MKRPFLKYIFSLLLFGSNGIVASNISINSTEIVFWRTMLGSLFLIALFFITGHKFTFNKNLKDTSFIALSGVAMGASWMFLYEAYAQVGVSLASLLYYTGPIIVMMLSPLIFKEKLTLNTIFGFATVLAGIFLLTESPSVISLSRFGIFCGLASAVTYSAMVIFNKKAVKVGGLENSLIQLFVSFLCLSIFIGIKTGFNISVPTEDIVWLLILGLLNTGFGCYLFFSAIGELPVQTVAIFGYSEALSAVVFATIFLGEKMLPFQILGAVFIIGGAILGDFKKHKTKKIITVKGDI